VEAILFAFVVAMIIRNYTFQNFVIPSSSMEKTLLTGTSWSPTR
jgi:signal peptidase I